MDAAGFVLVGGQSRRMGRDKALLPHHSGVLVEEIAAKLAAVTVSVALVGPPERYRHLHLDCIPDRRPGLGPLAGVEAALASARGEWNLIVACDMPDIDTPLLKKLIDTAKQWRAQCALATDETGESHPLCAVYHASCLPIVSGALDRGRLKLLETVHALQPVTVHIGGVFRNVNTPEEWRALQTDAHGR